MKLQTLIPGWICFVAVAIGALVIATIAIVASISTGDVLENLGTDARGIVESFQEGYRKERHE